jgi:hypothetical protein
MEPDEEKGFTVRDRRSASPHGGKEPAAGAAAGPAEEKAAGEAAGQASKPGPMPEVDFSSLVLSLAGTAQMGMGNLPHPETGKPAQDLPAAKQMIDILAILKDKTKGNLSKEEDTLLEQVLFNLRMHYVRVVESNKKSGG